MDLSEWTGEVDKNKVTVHGLNQSELTMISHSVYYYSNRSPTDFFRNLSVVPFNSSYSSLNASRMSVFRFNSSCTTSCLEMQNEAPSFDRYLEPKSSFRFYFEVHYVDCSGTIQLHEIAVIVLQYMPFKSIAISRVIVLIFKMGVDSECCHVMPSKENYLIVTI